MTLLATKEQVRSLVKSKRAGQDPAGVNAEDDFVIDLFLEGFSDWVIHYVNRQFYPEPEFTDDDPPADVNTPVAKTFRYPLRGDMRIPDLRVVESIAMDGVALVETVGIAPYTLTGKQGQPYTWLKLNRQYLGYGTTPTLTIVGRWGFTSVPKMLQMAVAKMAARAYKERDANYGDITQVGVEDTLFRYYRHLPPDVQMAIDAFRMPKIDFL